MPYRLSDEIKGEIFCNGQLSISDNNITLNLQYPTMKIKNVIFNNPATIVYWKDGTKTVVKHNENDPTPYDKTLGLAMAISKRALGNKGNFNEIFKEYIWNEEDEENDKFE